MKKSRHLPFYLPNNQEFCDNAPIPEPEDNLYNNPHDREIGTYMPKSQISMSVSKKPKKPEKDSSDEI